MVDVWYSTTCSEAGSGRAWSFISDPIRAHRGKSACPCHVPVSADMRYTGSVSNAFVQSMAERVNVFEAVGSGFR
jgi:hypothetical protein